jgi:hypothetical protein
MKKAPLLFALGIFLTSALGVLSTVNVHAQSAKPVYKEIMFDDLLPAKWLSEIKIQMAAIGRLGFLVDGSEEADRAMQQLRSKWDTAPIDTAYLGQPIRIAGYAVTLDANKKQISEFLLVPYFGACIHLPPPPANQTILVRLQKPITKLASMDTVWVQGILRDARVDTGLAVTGYALEAASTEPYIENKRQGKKGSAAHP